MNLKTGVYALISMMGLSALSFHVKANTDYIKIIKDKKVIADAVRIDDLTVTTIFKKPTSGQTYKSSQLCKKRVKLSDQFCHVNAGMYHPNLHQ